MYPSLPLASCSTFDKFDWYLQSEGERLEVDNYDVWGTGEELGRLLGSNLHMVISHTSSHQSKADLQKDRGQREVNVADGPMLTISSIELNTTKIRNAIGSIKETFPIPRNLLEGESDKSFATKCNTASSKFQMHDI